jgi:hypothetical protein
MLREALKNYKIVFASGSPRRQQFFRDLDIDFEIRLKEVDEVYPPDLQSAQITEYLARLKVRPSMGCSQTMKSWSPAIRLCGMKESARQTQGLPGCF